MPAAAEIQLQSITPTFNQFPLSYRQAGWQTQSWKGLRPAGEKVVARKKSSALEALARLDEERAALSEREAALKREAALELGTAVLAGGGAVLRTGRLKQLVEQVVAIGPDEAARRLSRVAQEPRSGPANAAAEEPAEGARHAAKPSH
jgi:hypothetical protein